MSSEQSNTMLPEIAIEPCFFGVLPETEFPEIQEPSQGSIEPMSEMDLYKFYKKTLTKWIKNNFMFCKPNYYFKETKRGYIIKLRKKSKRAVKKLLKFSQEK